MAEIAKSQTNSSYDSFVARALTCRLANGKRLAFNALSCGLAEIDADSYEVFLGLCNGGRGVDVEKHEELVRNLKLGGFLIKDDIDELDGIRAAHYQSRFGNRGFGLTIIPTYNCNFACDYCYESSDLHSMPRSEGSVMSDEVCDNLAFARVIATNCPNGPDKSTAIRKVREPIITANAAIACCGKP